MLEPLSEHDLLVFWGQFALLLAVARGLGYAFRRMGQPAVVGELGAGLLLGPSLFARLLPGPAAEIFPGTVSESAPILAIAWVGVALLLVETGFETDLKLLRSLGRQASAVSVGSLVVPLAIGFGLGAVMPGEVFYGENASSFTFAAFIAVAMSISALPVVARIMVEMNLMRRSIAQVTVAAAMVNDLFGWILLGVLSGIVASGGVQVGATLTTVVAIAAFFAFALTIGQRLADRALRAARQASEGLSGPLTVTVVVVLVAATITQAIGVEAVLGAFIAGIVLGRSPYQVKEVRRTIELMSAAVFAPIFFATAGIYVDLGALASGSGIFWAVVVIVAATVAKLVGSYVGARAGGMSHGDGLALGYGLNARGAMEIVLATIAFSIGVFSQDAYTIIVLMAMVTSLMAPPLLRRALRDIPPEAAEAARLEREEVLATSIVASASRALLPTRGGKNSRLAADVLHLVLQDEARATVLTVHDPDRDGEDCRCDEAMAAVEERLEGRGSERRRILSSRSAEAILAEAGLGYDLLALGVTEEFRDTHELSGVLQDLIGRSTVPLVLVRHGVDDADVKGTRRVLVPSSGVRLGRAAEELGAVLAARLDADLDLVHVVSRSDRASGGAPGAVVATRRTPDKVDLAPRELLAQAVERAEQFGARVGGTSRTGAVPAEVILEASAQLGSDLLVLSTQARAVNGRPFLGHGTEFLLEHAPQTVVVVIFPAAPEG